MLEYEDKACIFIFIRYPQLLPSKQIETELNIKK